jgi:hypothetical protein
LKRPVTALLLVGGLAAIEHESIIRDARLPIRLLGCKLRQGDLVSAGGTESRLFKHFARAQRVAIRR